MAEVRIALVIGDLWGGNLNAGETEEVRLHAELASDPQEVVPSIECERAHSLPSTSVAWWRSAAELRSRRRCCTNQMARSRVIWTVRIQGQDGLVLRVTDAFLHELFSRVRDPIVKQLDPYRDSILDPPALVRWCRELARVKQEIRAEVEHRLVRERGLPRDPVLGEALLREWVDRDLAADEHFKTLIEVEALVNLVLEVGGVINVFGD